jgi:hypothetical protein
MKNNKKIEPNYLEGDITEKKNYRPIVIKWSIIMLSIILSIYFIFRLVGAFFDKYKLLFPKMVEIKLNWPVMIVKRSTLDPTLSIQEEIDRQLNSPENVKKLIELVPTATPTAKPKPRASIVIPVQAAEGRHYQKYSKAKYYDEIISKLKVMYTEWEDAADLLSHEGGFDPSVKNKTSGACGLPQALPCSKMKCTLDDSGIDCQLNWMKDYISGRYGTVTNALNFWNSRTPINGKDVGNWY